MALRWKIAQWFELRWWKGYLSDKEKSAYLNWKRIYWEGIIKIIEGGPSVLLLPAPSNSLKGEPAPLQNGKRGFSADKKIIDFGCGLTGIFIALPENNIVAVDPLIDEYERQTSFFRKEDYPNVTFIKSTIEDFALQGSGSPFCFIPTISSGRESEGEGRQLFDYVFCMNAINHVQNIKKGFEKLKEVCADNGTIIISIDAHNFSFFKYLFRLIPGDILHPHQYDLKEYENFLGADGWQVTYTRLLKQGFVFDHYLLMAEKSIILEDK